MNLDKQHAEQKAREQCLALERQAKELLEIGYKLNELEIVSFTSDGRREVWPKSLVGYFHKTKEEPTKPPLLTEQLKWSKQVPWIGGYWWSRVPGVLASQAVVLNVRVTTDSEKNDPEVTYLCEGSWHSISTFCEYAGPIPEPIN